LTGYGIALNGVDNSNETNDQLNQTLADCAANAPVAVPTIDSNVNDGSTQCATAVLAQYGISPTDALTLILNGSNPDLMSVLMACGADSVGTQADATATESNWLIQQLKELSNE
jgi:hypothetical protein